jgi:rhodanese-related sulfurtransferase
MKTFEQLVQAALTEVGELFPWELLTLLQDNPAPLLLDIREQDEFDFCHIKGSLFVPRGLLEQACDWNYDVTVPELVRARDKKVVVICRSGTRSVLAALTMKLMGYQDVVSLKTGVRGWNDYDQPLYNSAGELVDGDDADDFLANKVLPEQIAPR